MPSEPPAPSGLTKLSKKAATREWLVNAEHDLRAAELLAAATSPLPDVAVYHCQQAAEKALKAFLFHRDIPFRKTHDLAELGDERVRLDASLAEVVDRAVDLTPFAWQFRYPAADRGEPSAEDAQEAIETAQATYDAVRTRIGAA